MAKRSGLPALRFRGRGRLWAALALAFAGPCPALAQGTVSVLPVQGLRFGVLASGIPAVVSPLDGSRRAVIELVGTGHVSLSFELPGRLQGGSGHGVLPVHFGPGDGRVTFPGSPQVLVFDPSQPVSFTIPPGSGGATVHLGGSVLADSRQPPGAYDAAFTVNVVVASPAT